MSRKVVTPTRLLLLAALAGGVATWWAVRLGMNSLELVSNTAFGLRPPSRPTLWYPDKVHAALFAAPAMGALVAAGIGWLGSAIQRDGERRSVVALSPTLRSPIIRPRSPGRAVVMAALAVGFVVWWAIRIALNTLDDIAITGIGTDEGFDHGPRNAATYAAPFIGLLVVVAVISFGFSVLTASGKRHASKVLASERESTPPTGRR